MADDHREAGNVYPRFSVKFVTRRMIIEKHELFTPVFSEVRYMTDDHREAGTVYPRFSVRFVTRRMIMRSRNCSPQFSVRFVT